jgi:hypothetical protein
LELGVEEAHQSLALEVVAVDQQGNLFVEQGLWA